MKSSPRSLLFLLACAGLPAFAGEIKKSDTPGQTKVEVGPVSVTVSVTGGDSGTGAMTPYLGVVMGSVSPQLRAQLDLPEGMGLAVEAVAADSPAAKAGLRRYDILKKFNDQMLCAPEQLSVLVKSAGKGAKVALVVLRGGKEQTVEVTLGEHEAPEGGRAQFALNGVPGISIEVQNLEKMLREGLGGEALADLFKAGGQGGPAKGGIHQNWQELLEKQKLRQKEIQEQVEKARKKAAEATGAARAQVFSFYPGSQSQSVVTMSDADGTIEINDTNGKRTVKIKDAAGKEIHSGALDTEADHDAVPEKFRARVREAEGKIKAPAGVPGKKVEKKPEPAKAPGGAI